MLRATTPCTFSTSQLPKESAPRPPVFNTFYFQMCFAPQRRALFRHLNFQKKVLRDRQFLTLLTSKCASRHNAVHFFDISTSKSAPRPPVFNTFDFEMCFAPQRRALFRHLNFQKEVLRDRQFLTLFTSKCASRHNAVHFFVISTSKAAPNPSVFNTFYFQMCFAPQRRALFQHLNFQKWSDPEVFCTFSLRNRLRATRACNFSSLISPDVSAPAALASLLFNPPEPQNHEKTSVSRLSYLFAHLHLLSSDLFSSDSSPC